MKPHRIMRNTTKNVGDPSSKYGYDRNGSRFEADMKAHKERYDYLWNEFVNFMESHDIIPSELRWMFLKYYEEFIE